MSAVNLINVFAHPESIGVRLRFRLEATMGEPVGIFPELMQALDIRANESLARHVAGNWPTRLHPAKVTSMVKANAVLVLDSL